MTGWLILSAVSGICLAVFSSSWLGVCVGLELNLLSFLPLLTLSSVGCSESGLKYFLVQSCGSLVMFTSGVILILGESIALNLVGLALAFKMGVAPLHFWYPVLVEGLGCGQVFLLSSLQKLAPLFLLSYAMTGMVSYLLYSMIVSSSVVGAIGGVVEFSMRKLLAYSSISHMGWILFSLVESGSSWVLYFLLYCIILWSLIIILLKKQIFHLAQLPYSSDLKNNMGVFLALLSLSGLPPMLGFFPKWMLIQEVGESFTFLILWFMVSMNVITSFYYMRWGVKSLMLSSCGKSTGAYSGLSSSVLINAVGGSILGGSWVSFMH